jgi:flagellar protein FliS
MREEMAQQTTVNGYQHHQVMHTSLEKLIVLLYEGALTFIHQGREALHNRELVTAGIKLLRARNIVSALRNGLDYEQGGELAVNLDRLYLFAHDEILRANKEGNPALLDPVIEVLTTLKEGWMEVSQKSDGKEIGKLPLYTAQSFSIPPALSPAGPVERQGLSITV